MDDLIRRKELIKELQEISTLEAISDHTGDMMFWVDKKAVYKVIEKLPTIQPQGIDKDRLEHAIKLLEFCKQRHIDIATQLPHTAEIEAGKISCYEMAIKIVRENLHQPTSNVPDTNVGEMPQSYKDRLIEEIFYSIRHEVLYGSYDCYEANTVLEIIDEIIELIKSQPTSNGWIPISSGELPKNAKDVFITTSWGAIYIAWLEKGVWNTDNFEFENNEVIAWQPLPPAYKESE